MSYFVTYIPLLAFVLIATVSILKDDAVSAAVSIGALVSMVTGLTYNKINKNNGGNKNDKSDNY